MTWCSTSRLGWIAFLIASAAVAGICGGEENGAPRVDAPAAASRPDLARFVGEYCIDCHNSDDGAGALVLDGICRQRVARHTEVWEKVVRKLRAREMPPIDMTRPTPGEYVSVLNELETALDRQYRAHPRPGRTGAFRRLNRTEYENVIRDLLALKIDARLMLPADDSSHGFDNVTVGDLSPTLLNRYLLAAESISRLALGHTGRSPGGGTFRIRPDVTQEEHVAGLPLGTRGGTLIHYNFPRDGEYDVRVRLARDRNEHVEGLGEPHQLELLLDRERRALFTVKPPPNRLNHDAVDKHLKARLDVAAGPHQLGVTFLKKPSSLLETKRQPFDAHYNMHRHPRISPAIYQVSISGPFAAGGPGDTPSRRRILICKPGKTREEEGCAREILAAVMRRAYRRPVTEVDLRRPLEFFRRGQAEGGFEAGIEFALSAVLVNPNFLFRIERDPPGLPPGTAYRISDQELASRLSFFLWSSIPDDELLDLAERGVLGRAEILDQQVSRMLADPRSESLVNNFAGQWLYLRNLESITPDLRLFPDFDDNLRRSFRRETEMFFATIVREDRSVLDLLKADFTYLDQRLARHYRIPHVYGSRFRRVHLDESNVRGGLLRQGSILTVTSYATRTSPVVRGNWILKNLLGIPSPPPPANVPALKDNTVDANLSVRQRLAEHRANPTCARCHDRMDPVGLALENFDAVGRWRVVEAGKQVDTSGGLPDGTLVNGVTELEEGLLNRPELFVGTLTAKLMTFALGRGMEYDDAPAIRQIVRRAKEDDYKFSSLIAGIVRSVPFRMRTSQ